MTVPSPWWDRDVYADRRPFLLARGRIHVGAAGLVSRAAAFSRSRPRRCRSRPATRPTCMPSRPSWRRRAAARTRAHLHTSPEFACKKLLAAGEPRIFTFARVFRNRERGPLHHPEFTMLEWYRADEPYEALMDDCAAILVEAAKAAGCLRLQWQGRTADPYAAPRAAHRRRGFENSPASTCWRRCTAARAGPRRARCGRARRRHAGRRRRHLVRHFQPRAGRADRAAARPRRADPARPNIPCRRPRWRAPPPIRASRSASSSMPAASSSPTALASSPTRPSSAAVSRPPWRRRSAAMASAIRSTRISWPRSQPCRRPAESRSASTGW